MCAVAGGLLDWESNEEGADSELGFYRAIMCFVCLWVGRPSSVWYLRLFLVS